MYGTNNSRFIQFDHGTPRGDSFFRCEVTEGLSADYGQCYDFFIELIGLLSMVL